MDSEEKDPPQTAAAPLSLQSHCVCVALIFTGIIITILCVICSLMFPYAGVKTVCHYGEPRETFIS